MTTNLLDRRSSFILVCLCLPFFFLPKINIIQFGGETAGIRMDDLMLLSLSGIVYWAHFSLNKTFNPVEKWIGIITVFSLFSWALNLLSYRMGWVPFPARLPYCIRLFEYFLYFYIGMMAFRFITFDSCIKAFFILNLLICVLQKLGIIGGFMAEGYVPHASWRLLGICSFPGELGVILNMLYCYFAFSPMQRTFLSNHIRIKGVEKFYLKIRTYWLFALFGILIIFSGSRIAIIALGICFVIRLYQEVKTYPKKYLLPSVICSFIIFIFCAYILSQTSSVANRSSSLFSKGNVEIAKIVWDYIDIDVSEYPDPEKNSMIGKVDTDMSWLIRIHRWFFALKVWVNNPQSWLFGIGPGFAAAAVDGGWIRILAEYGIVGLGFFLMLFWRIASQSRTLFWIMIAFGLNMVFFDVYLAYKPMSFICISSGFVYAASYAAKRRDSVLAHKDQRLDNIRSTTVLEPT